MVYYFLTFILQPSNLPPSEGQKNPCSHKWETGQGKRSGLCKVQSDFCFCIRYKQNRHIFSQVHRFCGFNCTGHRKVNPERDGLCCCSFHSSYRAELLLQCPSLSSHLNISLKSCTSGRFDIFTSIHIGPNNLFFGSKSYSLIEFQSFPVWFER